MVAEVRQAVNGPIAVTWSAWHPVPGAALRPRFLPQSSNLALLLVVPIARWWFRGLPRPPSESASFLHCSTSSGVGLDEPCD